MGTRFKTAAVPVGGTEFARSTDGSYAWSRPACPVRRSDAMKQPNGPFLRLLPRLAAAAVLALPATSPASRAQTAPPTVTATIIGVSVSIWPAIVAEQKGFFAEEGVKVDMISAGASTRSLQQVAAGSAD